MIARSVALLVVALQLQPAVLPALCDHTRAGKVPECEQPMFPTHDGIALTDAAGDAPCVNPALCGIAQPATPGSASGVVAISAGSELALLLRPGLHAINPTAPPLPPPEA